MMMTAVQRKVAMVNRKERILKIAKLLTLLIWIGIIIVLVINHEHFSAVEISSYTPENPFLAAIFILFLYACKTISMIFPFKVIQLVAGMMFPVLPAILVNLLGAAVSSAVGYCRGLFLGTAAVQKMIQKNQKLSRMLERQNHRIIFFSFLLRSLVFLPLDAVSMYFGAAKVDFKKYMLGSVLGLLPNVIISTLMGESISDPTSSAFIGSLFLAITMISLIWYAKIEKKENVK